MTATAKRKHLADEHTPLIHDAWYVAAFSDEIGRELTDRWLLERNILFYRTEAGQVTAMQNRCPHRSFPLSKGRLEGDTVVCGYHGLAFDACGGCVAVPSQDKIPPTLNIRRYPTVERAPFIWIWMGDAEAADEAAIPELPWFGADGWVETHGYTPVKCNYIRLHENLLDLTHFTYLHPDNVGTPEYALAPFEVSSDGGQVRIDREVADCPAPPLYDVPMELGGRRVDRKSESFFVSPALHVAKPSIRLRDPGPNERAEFKVRYAHALTPASARSSHYFWAVARDFALESEAATEFLRDSIVKAFNEDVEALEWIEEIAAQDGDPGYMEISVKADAAGNKMRALIQGMADQQAAA